MSSIDSILYFNSPSWNIEGSMYVDDKLYENAYGEAIVSRSRNMRGEAININRTFSSTTEDGLIYFQFDDTIIKSELEENICRYSLNTPIAADTLTGLYVLSFDFIHATYSQKYGNFSAQETFMKNADGSYSNNGFIFKNARLHIRWNFLYTQN